MHTAICAFDTHEQAHEAMAALERAGFQHEHVHEEHKFAATARREANDGWDGMEREVAVDRGVLASFGHFFASLLGRDDPTGRVDTYTKHVERGGHVVVVDVHDEAEARRAGELLRELRARELHVLHRPEQRPLRDIVDVRQAGAAPRGRDTLEPAAAAALAAPERERAMASGRVSPTAGPDLRDPDAEWGPGLRYADKDKPL
jgi:hypothetical protein